MKSSRVKDDDDVDWVSYGRTNYAIVGKPGRVRVYEDGSYYSSTSGGVGAKGKVLRGLDGSILNFRTTKDAEKWILAGLPITNSFGDEFDPTKETK